MEFLEYEKAIAKHYDSLSLMAAPLISWDFYLQGLSKVKMSVSDATQLKKLVYLNNWKSNWDFQEHLQDDTVIVVTDPRLKIVFASKNIVKMNGYYPIEVIGNSPKMFQGQKTNKKISKEISEAVKNQRPFDKVIINYCKDGSLYKCHIKGYPIFDKKGELINFIAFEKIAA